MPEILRPRALSSGDLVVVTAPSGQLAPGEEPLLARGVAILERMGFRVRVSPMVDPARHRWWASGTPAEQAEELNGLLRDPEVRAVVAHTGGQATIGYLDLIDLDAIRADPKPIIGYSDISLLHMALYSKTGLVGLHADIATHGFGSDWYTLGDAARRSELVDLYTRVLTKAEAPGVLPAGGAWETWRPGRAQGPLFGGLLNRLVLLQATPFALAAERFDGAVLFWRSCSGRSRGSGTTCIPCGCPVCWTGSRAWWSASRPRSRPTMTAETAQVYAMWCSMSSGSVTSRSSPRSTSATPRRICRCLSASSRRWTRTTGRCPCSSRRSRKAELCGRSLGRGVLVP